MALIEINTDPSPSQLRFFGVGLFIFAAVFATLTYFRSGSVDATAAVLIVTALIALTYQLLPSTRLYIYRGWLYTALPIGWVVSHIAVALVFYGVLTPIALGLRTLGRDPLERQIDRNRKSYWTARSQRQPELRRYFQQF
jgi:hypothetical protein